MRPSFAVEESIRLLGANLKAARLRRRLPRQWSQSVLAFRSTLSQKWKKAIAVLRLVM